MPVYPVRVMIVSCLLYASCYDVCKEPCCCILRTNLSVTEPVQATSYLPGKPKSPACL